MKIGEPGDKVGDLFGLPVVASDEMPKGEVIFGYFPTAEEIRESGCKSLQEWVEKHPTRFTKIKNIDQ